MSLGLVERLRSASPATPSASPSAARLLLVGLGVALWTCLAGLAVVAAPVLIAWVGAGATEPFADALSVAAAGWLLGLGATLTTGGSAFGIAPLGLSAVLLVLAFRGGGWAVESSRPATASRAGALLAMTTVSAAVVGGMAASLVTLDGLAVDPGEAAGRAALLTGAGAGAGMLASSPDWRAALLSRVFTVVRRGLRPALGATALLAAAAAFVTTVALVGSFGSVASLLEQIDPGLAGALALLLVSLAYLPTLMVWVVALLAGVDITLGTQVTVGPDGVDAGPLPGFPLLAAVPESMPPWFRLLGVGALVLAGLVAGLLIHRRGGADEPLWWPAVSASVAGVLVAAVVGVLSWAVSGPMGPGELSWVGVPAASVAGTCGLAVAVVGSGSATLLAWRRSRLQPQA